MSKLDLEAIKGRLEAAIQMVSDLCHKRREWIMSIPVREGYDPDVVIGASQGDCRKLIERVEELERDNQELAFANHHLKVANKKFEELAEMVLADAYSSAAMRAKARECTGLQSREILPEHEHPNIKDQIGDSVATGSGGKK